MIGDFQIFHDPFYANLNSETIKDMIMKNRSTGKANFCILLDVIVFQKTFVFQGTSTSCAVCLHTNRKHGRLYETIDKNVIHRDHFILADAIGPKKYSSEFVVYKT